MEWLQKPLQWYMNGRLQALDKASSNPLHTQQQTFKALIQKIASTKFGTDHHLKTGTAYSTFAQQVPVRKYEDLWPYIDQMLAGETDVLWPGKIKWFAQSSGTSTGRSKWIPVSTDALRDCHYRAGRDVLALYARAFPNHRLYKGKSIIMGGSHQVNTRDHSISYGDLSAVLIQNMNPLGRWLSALDAKTALMDEWESKLKRMIEVTRHKNITSLAGVPSWTLVFLQQLLERTGNSTIKDIWPDLEVFIHGGVSFEPYRAQFNKLFPHRSLNYWQTYNASEGFFAAQDEANRDDMLLMTDYGIFYEFVPLDQSAAPFPNALRLNEVELGKTYCLVITTNSGLVRYAIGDTIEFTSLQPPKIKVAGRTKSFINAFGEELMVANADKAIARAAETSGVSVKDYTAAPVFLKSAQGLHHWLIETEDGILPEVTAFTNELDEALKSLNSDYAAKRYNNFILQLPRVQFLPKGHFHQWLKKKGKLGGQHKVPRLSNDSNILKEILALLNEDQ